MFERQRESFGKDSLLQQLNCGIVLTQVKCGCICTNSKFSRCPGAYVYRAIDQFMYTIIRKGTKASFNIYGSMKRTKNRVRPKSK